MYEGRPPRRSRCLFLHFGQKRFDFPEDEKERPQPRQFRFLGESLETPLIKTSLLTIQASMLVFKEDRRYFNGMRVYRVKNGEVRPGMPTDELPAGLVRADALREAGELRDCQPLYETSQRDRENALKNLTRTDESSYMLTEIGDEKRPREKYGEDVLLFYDSGEWLQSPELGDFSELVYRSPSVDAVVARRKRTFLVPVLSKVDALVVYERRRPECLKDSGETKKLVLQARRTERRRRKLTVLLSV